MIKIEDFIRQYPSSDDINLQKQLYRLQEFYELRSKENENMSIKPGEYYNDQKAFARFMDDHDVNLNMGDTGSGKTCKIIGWAEIMKKHSATIQGLYYITSRALIGSTKSQILCDCTPGNYITPDIRKATSIRKQDSAITRSLKIWYKLKPHGSFADKNIRAK